MVDPFSNRGRRGTNFQDGLSEPFHRWFTITPSYAPRLVADCATHLELTRAGHLLDPFAGAGTTAVWCRLAAIPSTSVEWNPALALIARVKAGLAVSPRELLAAGADFANDWQAALPSNTAIDAFLATEAAWQPAIAHRERWWNPEALAALTAARKQLADWPVDAIRPGLELALLRLLLPASRARYSHASVTFDRLSHGWTALEILAAFRQNVTDMAEDLALAADRPQCLGLVLQGNSRNLSALLPTDAFSHLICSPPYPNRYSYARETRPHLFFLDLIAGAPAVGDLEVAAIGGTWGRATSRLAHLHEPEPTVVAGVMASLLPRLRAAHPLMANYAVRYFNDLWEHLQTVNLVMTRQARLAYVVGNSKLGGILVPTAEWLAELARVAGWRLFGRGIYTLRRRNSRPGLVESVVFLER